MHKRILALAVPSILANITVPLVGMADTAIAGHLGDASFIGGIAVGTMLFDLLYWNFAFLRVGTGGLAAQAFGRRDFEDSARIFTRGIITAMLCVLVIWVLQWFVVKGAFFVVDCSDRVRELALQYFHIRIWAAPATLSMFVFKGWFIGMQDTLRPMIIDIFVNVVNIAVSVWLALGTPLGYKGVAYGTLAAQYSGLALSFALLWLRYRHIFKGISLTRVAMGGNPMEFFRMNGNLFIRSICFIFVYIGFTTISAHYGDELLAVGAILMKLLMIFSFFIDGFAYAGEALAGRYVGEGNLRGFKDAVAKIFIWGGAISVMFVFVYRFCSEMLLGIMTSDPAVTSLAMEYIPWLMLMPPLGCAAFIWDGVFIGATQTASIRNSMIFAAVAFFVLYYVCAFIFGLPLSGVLSDAVETSAQGQIRASVLAATGVHTLCAAYFAHLVMRSLYMTLKFKSLKHKCFPS